jgi:5-methylcytosine-specific restriction endonuclease McrA
MRQEVLVLNSDYEPLNVCNIKRAVNLVFLGKVDVLHSDTKIIHTISGAFDSPSVVRLRRHVKRPLPELRLSRKSIFARDGYACQYCGHKSKELTIDHVIPKRVGGATSWDNLVCCCRRCNTKKGDKTLQKVGFTLNRLPKRPKYIPFISLNKYLEGARNQVWRDYLPIFDDLPELQQAISEEGN